jgi:Flp pilus assembly protein TadG
MRTDNGRNVRGGERNGERGAIAILMALSLTMLMGFAAIGFDLSYVRLARLEMKNASDAAAHAAITRLRSSATNYTGDALRMAETVALANTVLGKHMVLQDSDVVFGTWNPTTQSFDSSGTPPTAVKINGVRQASGTNDGYVNLMFGRILGYTQSSITEDTIGAFVNRNFMVEMDITPSYICDIDNAVKADLALLDDLHAKNIGGDRISLDVFTGKATDIGEQSNSPYKGFSNIRDNYAGIYRLWAGGTMNYATFLDGGKTSGITVCNKLDDTGPAPKGGQFDCPKGAANRNYPNNPNIQSCSQDGPTGYATALYAGTDIGAAIRAGTAKLKSNSQTWEPRILIIVTDGSPMTCTAPGGGDICSNGGNPCCADGFCNVANAAASGHQWRIDACNAAHQILDDAVAAAAAAAAENIDLFIIKITGTKTDVSSTWASSLKQNKGTFTWINDATELAGTFKDIVGQVPVTLVK